MSDPVDLKTEFEYHLTTPFTYSHAGDQVEASFVRLTAPTSRHSRECAALTQAFFVAVPKGAGSDTPQKDVEITGDDVIALLAASTDVDLPKLFDVGRKLFTSHGIALVDGETKLTGPLLDRMSQIDFQGMLGDYLVNFILASTLAQTKMA